MNVAENVPLLILLATDASVSFMPCFFSRSATRKGEGNRAALWAGYIASRTTALS
jgi:hypothetical protein